MTSHIHKLIFPKGKSESNRASLKASKGEWHRIRAGVYATVGDPEAIEQLIYSRWYDIAHALCPPGTIVAYRTAIELHPVSGEVFLAAPIDRRKTIDVHPSLTLHLFPSVTDVAIEPFIPNLFRAKPSRQCLENLTKSRGRRKGIDKSLGEESVEKILCDILRQRGEDELNLLRDEARVVADALNLIKEFSVLDKKVGALLSTHSIEGTLSTLQGYALARKTPFDEARLESFSSLVRYIQACNLPTEPYEMSKSSWRNLSFFESYFSNYIEGTEFEIDEAAKIVFERTVINDRYADSHDVLAVFDIVSDYQEMLTTPDDADELIHLIQDRHRRMMAKRPNKNPGEFKTLVNRAGDTLFVAPNDVIGTLTQAIPFYKALPAGMPRAIFMHYLISECHPMDDGNGRLARIFMNAELVAVDQHKIIMPTVHRDSYLLGQRNATRSGQFRTMVKVAHQMHRYTASIPWGGYGESLELLEKDSADKSPDEGVPNFNRKISQLSHMYPPG